MAELNEFIWAVHGCDWGHATEPGRRCGPDFEMVVDGSVPKVSRYSPLERTSLFLDFADTRRNLVEVLKFANRFGVLNKRVHIPAPLIEHEGPVVLPGENLYVWIREITEMREVVNLWSL